MVALLRLGKRNSAKWNNKYCLLFNSKISVWGRKITYVTERRVLSERLILTQFFLGVSGIRVFWKTVVPRQQLVSSSTTTALVNAVTALTVMKSTIRFIIVRKPQCIKGICPAK